MDEHLKNGNTLIIPTRIVPSRPMEAPNEKINVFTGQFVLKNGTWELVLEGHLEFTWFPNPGVNFSGDVLSGNMHELAISERIEVWFDGLKFSDGHISDRNMHANLKTHKEAVKGTCFKKAVSGDKSIPVEKVMFSVPNLREYVGFPVTDQTENQTSTSLARLILDNNEFSIVIDQVKEYRTRYGMLNSIGGYITLYGGEMVKKKGVILFDELNEAINCLNHFLSFLNGRSISIYFMEGSFEGEISWKDFTGYPIKPFQPCQSWSNIINIFGIKELWQTFSEMWKDQSSKQFLQILINWYLDANSDLVVEGKIIFAQTALELIYNWLIVETKMVIIGDEAENLSAANKIRLILSQLKVSSEIPASLSHLRSLDYLDAPEAFVSMRNALVHGQERKRSKIMEIPLMAKYEAQQLAVWYIELAALYILKYQGKYFNRTSENVWMDTGETLPWVS